MTFMPLSTHMHVTRAARYISVYVKVPIKNSYWVQWNPHSKPFVFVTRQGLHLEEYVCVGQLQTFSKGFIRMVPFHSGYDSGVKFVMAKKYNC